MFEGYKQQVQEVIRHNYDNIAKYFGISDDFGFIKIEMLPKDEACVIKCASKMLCVYVGKDVVRQRTTYTVAECNGQMENKVISIVPIIQGVDGVFGYNYYDGSYNVILSQFVDIEGKCMVSTTDQISVENIKVILNILQQEFKNCIDGKVNEEVRVAYWLLSISLLSCSNCDIR